MITQLNERLEELKRQYEAGQQMLSDLEVRHAQTRDTLLRISGGMLVIQELLAASAQPNDCEPAIESARHAASSA